eukprot:m51a1_g8962 putative neurochondrin isoform x1 (682) ;mRNA; r:1062312-1064553
MEGALSLLRGGSDDHKLAGLLLLARTLQRHAQPPTPAPSAPESPASGGVVVVLGAAFEATGPQFFARLLRTPPAAQPQSQSPSFRELAVCVLSALCSDPCVPPRAAPLCPLVADALADARSDSEAADALRVLGSLPAAQLLRCAGPERLARALALRAAAAGCSAAVRQHALALLCAVAAADAPAAERHALPALCARMRAAQDPSKFDLLAALARIAPALCGAAPALPAPAAAEWHDDARAALAAVLSARLGPEQRCAALEVAAAMLRLRGPAWAVAPWPQRLLAPAEGPEGPEGPEGAPLPALPPPHALAALMASLASVEVRVLLETRGLEESDLQTRTIAAAFGVLEAALEGTGAAEDAPWSALPCESLLALRSALRGAVYDAIGYVLKHAGPEAPEAPAAPAAAPGAPLLACLRLVGAWAACEPDDLREELCEALPAVLCALRAHRPALDLVLPGLSNVAAEPSGALRLADCGALQLLAAALAHSAAPEAAALARAARAGCCAPLPSSRLSGCLCLLLQLLMTPGCCARAAALGPLDAGGAALAALASASSALLDALEAPAPAQDAAAADELAYVCAQAALAMLLACAAPALDASHETVARAAAAACECVRACHAARRAWDSVADLVASSVAEAMARMLAGVARGGAEGDDRETAAEAARVLARLASENPRARAVALSV